MADDPQQCEIRVFSEMANPEEIMRRSSLAYEACAEITRRYIDGRLRNQADRDDAFQDTWMAVVDIVRDEEKWLMATSVGLCRYICGIAHYKLADIVKRAKIEERLAKGGNAGVVQASASTGALKGDRVEALLLLIQKSGKLPPKECGLVFNASETEELLAQACSDHVRRIVTRLYFFRSDSNGKPYKQNEIARIARTIFRRPRFSGASVSHILWGERTKDGLKDGTGEILRPLVIERLKKRCS